MDDLQKILELVDKQFQTVKLVADSPHALTEIANSLATLLYNIGDYAVNAIEIADQKEAAMKDAYDDAYLGYLTGEEKISQGKAEVLARNSCRGQRDEWILAKRQANKLKILRADMDRKISTLQSHVSLLRSQLSQTNI